MFWLIAMIATLGVGGASLFATLNRMGANLVKIFRDAPELTSDKLAEGAYGRISGVVSSSGQLPVAPGVGVPCVLYELVVYEHYANRADAGAWRLAHREMVGGEIDVSLGDVVVRVDAREVYLADARSHDEQRDLRRNPRAFQASSRVRYVPPGAQVQ